MFFRKALEQEAFRNTRRHKLIRNQGYRSIRAVGQRYRIIYQIEQNLIVVYIVGVGLRKQGSRKDIYNRLENFLED